MLFMSILNYSIKPLDKIAHKLIEK